MMDVCCNEFEEVWKDWYSKSQEKESLPSRQGEKRIGDGKKE